MHRWTAIGLVVAVPLAACGGDDDDAGESDAGTAADDSAAASDGGDSGADTAGEPAGDDNAADQGSGGGGGGTLVLGDETIELESARCFLQEQEAAAGGGKILFVAQGFGATAAGDELVLDVSRYDEDSQFAGDDMTVDIGDPFSADAVSLSATGEIGTVTVDGSNVSADDVTFSDFDSGTEQTGSFEINC